MTLTTASSAHQNNISNSTVDIPTLYTHRHLCLRAKRCKSKFCLTCQNAQLRSHRNKLLSGLRSFRKIQMVSLTVDPTPFVDGHAAYTSIMEKKKWTNFIRRLFRRLPLNSRRYAWALEFQENGMPHFHILLDAMDLPIDVIHEQWGWGTTDVSPPPEEGDPVKTAAHYLTKTPQHVPQWARQMHLIRTFGTSQKFNFDDSSSPYEIECGKTHVPRPYKPRSKSRKTYAEREADCGQSTQAFEIVERRHSSSHRVLYRFETFQGEYKIPFGELCHLYYNADAHELKLPFSNVQQTLDAISARAGRRVDLGRFVQDLDDPIRFGPDSHLAPGK